jgi:adenylylsulfate kinase-like enzyme
MSILILKNSVFIWLISLKLLFLIYAGLMGSGKTTVGKIVGEVLGYSVFDRFAPIK